MLYLPPGCESLTSKITGQVSCNQIVSISPGPTIPEILMTQANLTQTPFLQMGKLGPKRHRDLPKVMNQLQGFFPCPPQVLVPAYSPATSPSLGQGSGTESRPVPGLTCCCPMGFQGGSCQMPRQFYFPLGCRALRTTVRSQALPFHSEPGFLSTPSIGPFHLLCRQQADQGPQFLCQLLGNFVSSRGPSPDCLGSGLPLMTVSALGNLWQKSLINQNPRRRKF